MIQAHRPQSMFYSPAPCIPKQDFSTGLSGQCRLTSFWGSKEDLMTTINFINGTGLQIYSMVVGTQKKIDR